MSILTKNGYNNIILRLFNVTEEDMEKCSIELPKKPSKRNFRYGRYTGVLHLVGNVLMYQPEGSIKLHRVLDKNNKLMVIGG